MALFQTLLFYKYTPIADGEKFAQDHLKFCKEKGLKGRVLVGDEGINGTVSGMPEQCRTYMENLSANPIFKGIEFKIDDAEDHSFSKMHVRYRPEIVTLKLGELDVNPLEDTGVYLSPEEFLKMKDERDVVVLDVRNTIEHEVGKFKGALTLDIDYFRDFSEKIQELEPFKDKKILAYCTGGIRCEKATAYLKKVGFKNVFQLHGGIINYGKVTGGKDFDGKCYVFDKRVVVDVNKVNPVVISNCYTCSTPSDRMVNCANPECNNHIAMCEECGWKMEGCCCESCLENPRRRPYDGTGYYMKGINSKNRVA